MDAWERLRRGLGGFAPDALSLPRGGRVGAALALIADVGDGDLEFVYTRRRDDLSHHPGQLSFPGGRVDPGETVEAAALREAAEEVGLRPDSAEVLGRMPAFYIAPSRFWLQAVVARWSAPHDLVAAQAEVAEVVRARVSRLRDPDVWRVVRLSTRGRSWAWQLDERNLLWGATAVVTATLLELLDPSWSGGRGPGDLMPDREVRPWEGPERFAPRPGPARLPGLAEVAADTLPRPVRTSAAGAPGGAAIERAGAAAAHALRLLRSAGAADAADARRGDPADAPAEAPVLVLAGAGGNGAAGLAAAGVLLDGGVDVGVVLAREPAALLPAARARLARLDGRASVFAGSLPAAAVVLDALIGAGLSGPLAGPAHAMVMALRYQVAPVVSLDLPSGLHPERGLLGDTVTADVTIAIEAPRPGLFLPGLAPFVGDLYLCAARPGPALARIVGPRPGCWRE